MLDRSLIVRMQERVAFGSKLGRKAVSFFWTMENMRSSWACECGIINTNVAPWTVVHNDTYCLQPASLLSAIGKRVEVGHCRSWSRTQLHFATRFSQPWSNEIVFNVCSSSTNPVGAASTTASAIRTANIHVRRSRIMPGSIIRGGTRRRDPTFCPASIVIERESWSVRLKLLSVRAWDHTARRETW